MNIKILLSRRGVLASLVFVVFAFALAGTLSAASIFDIEYPIAELGDCENGKACKAYCDVADHRQACEDFAAKFGVGKAAKHKENVKDLVADGGPGNCATKGDDPEASCRAYCDIQANMRECVEYGKDHGLMEGDELAEAEKVIKALDSGAKLPAGCANKESCRKTCEEPNDIETARQCFAFAEQAGLLPPNVDRARAEKTFRLIAEGKAPFKSIKDFKQCEETTNEEILQKCISFAADNGLMSPEEAEIVKKTGGKGPGGCVGKAQCDTYCKEHQDECFRFAEEHNLIRPEDRARMEEGSRMLKESFSNAPDEVKSCISETVGDDVLDQILEGKRPPSPKIGDAMRACFEKAFGGRSPQEGMMAPGGEPGFLDRGMFQGQDGGRNMPSSANFSPEVEACIISKIGEDGLNKIKHPSGPSDQTVGSVIGGCFRQIEGPRAGPGGCTSAEECKAFCSDPANAGTCNVPIDGSMRQGGGEMNVPDHPLPPAGEYNRVPPPTGNFPQGYGYPQGAPMPDGQYAPGQYPPPPGDGMYPSPDTMTYPTAPTQPPPPVSLLHGIRNIASVVFSLLFPR